MGKIVNSKYLSLILVLTFLMVIAVGSNCIAALTSDQRVVGIEVTGNKNISSEAILGAVKTKVGDTVNDKILDSEVNNIRALGYFYNVSCDYALAKGGIKVKFQVFEYPLLRKVTIIGNTVYSSDRLIKELNLPMGEVINSVQVGDGLNRIVALYKAQGYIFAGIGDIDNPGSDGELKIPIVERKLENYRVDGELKTKKYVITREIDLVPGEVFNIQHVNKNLQKIFGLGFFEDIQSSYEQGLEPDGIVLVIKPKEKLSTIGDFNFGVTYSSEDAWIGSVGFSESNFRGMAQDLSVGVDLGKKTTNYQLSFYDPWIDSKHTSFGIGVFDTTKDKADSDVASSITRQIDVDGKKVTQTIEDTNKYTSKEKGWYVSLGRPLDLETRVNLKLSFKNTEKIPLENSIVAPKKENIRSITVSAVTDTRDSNAYPTSGRRDVYSLEAAGKLFGGDTAFTKAQASLCRYYKAGSQQVWALRLAGGAINGDAPSAELFDLGGVDSIRGYEDNEFEGKKMALFNAEYRFPIYKQFTGHVFYDMGTVWDTGLSQNPGDLKTGYGLGINFNLNIGIADLPIRLDYGRGDGKPKWHFGLSQAF